MRNILIPEEPAEDERPDDWDDWKTWVDSQLNAYTAQI
jgi:hypothetical protein